MSFMDGFILRAGESSRERNMLDIQNKIAKHKAFTDHVQKISEDPSYSPEAQEAAKRRWLEAVSTDPLKFKKYDISDILTVTNPSMVGVPAAPQGERPSILPSGSEGRTLFEGWEKTLPGSPAAMAEGLKATLADYQPERQYKPSGTSDPHQFGDIFMYTPRQDTGYTPATRRGKWSPEEAAYLAAQEKALADETSYQRTFDYRKQLQKPGANPIDMRAKTPGSVLLENGYTHTSNGSPIKPDLIYPTGTHRLTGEFMIGEAELPSTPAGPLVVNPDGTYSPTRYNPITNQMSAVDLPQGSMPLVPSDEHKIPLSIGGKTDWYAYRTDSNGNYILDKDGRINFTPTEEPIGYAANTTTSMQLQNFENERRWVASPTTTKREPTPIPLTANKQTGDMTFMGVPISINGNPIRYEHRDPATGQVIPPTGAAPQGMPPTGEGGVPIGVAPNQPTPPPPSVDIPAIVPGREPAGGRTISEQYKRRLQPIRYNPKEDLYWAKRPDLDASSIPEDFKRNAIHNPHLIPKPMIFDPGSVPESVLSNPQVSFGQKHMLRVATLEEVQKRRDEEEAYVQSFQSRQGRDAVITPDSGPIRKGPKPMTELQMQTSALHINTMSTTADLLGKLLQPNMLAATKKLTNRLRIHIANDDSLKARLASGVLEPLDKFIGEPEKQLVREVAAVRRNLTEHIQVIRTPLGAAGFRSLEAFFALQAQYGDILVSPKITETVLRNTMKTVLTIRAAYVRSLNLNRRLQVDLDGNSLAGPNYPDAKTVAEYRAAYGNNQEAAAAMLRDGYVAPPPQAAAQ